MITGLWMYCILENNEQINPDCFGIHGTSPVRIVSNGRFAAAVSDEPVKKYPLERDTLLAHARVCEQIMKNHKILPVRFCTIAENEEKIIGEVLRPKTGEFREIMSRMADKAEYGLRVRWKDLDALYRDVGETDEKILAKKKKISSLPESQKRMEMIDIGHLVKEAVEKKNMATAEALLAQLNPLACDVRTNKTLGDSMILNSAFLVSTKRQEEFDKVVSDLDSRYGDRLHFKYIGPVPPFNFVEIVIRWDEEPFAKKEALNGLSA